jgi:hypothetical protein
MPGLYQSCAYRVARLLAIGPGTNKSVFFTIFLSTRRSAVMKVRVMAAGFEQWRKSWTHHKPYAGGNSAGKWHTGKHLNLSDIRAIMPMDNIASVPCYA